MKKNNYPSHPVLLVDDEEHFLESCAIGLRAAGINNIIALRDGREVVPLLAGREVDAVLLDVRMPHVSGKDLLPRLAQEFPHVPVIILTGVDELETAVECMKSGAFDYMTKPVEESRLVSGIRRAVEFRELRRENSTLKDHLLSDKIENPEAFSGILTRNPAMRSIFQYVESIAASSRPALITGETGVGKELVAQAIHALSGREGSFVPVNIAGLDDAVFADTLFGHKKGAFTGADQPRSGLAERAAGGTLFLDEIGDLESASQIKLLRLLQEGEYYPLGSDVPKATDARIIVATNGDLPSLQREGKFRKDLYFRLSAHLINIPPLRNRWEDLPLLVDHFMGESAAALGKKKPAWPRELVSLLSTYAFPGNIRELQGMVHDAVSRDHRGTLPMDSFRDYITRTRGEAGGTSAWKPGEEDLAPTALEIREDPLKKFPTLEEAENFLVREAMKRANDNQTIAAELLGLTRSALNKRLNRKRK